MSRSSYGTGETPCVYAGTKQALAGGMGYKSTSGADGFAVEATGWCTAGAEERYAAGMTPVARGTVFAGPAESAGMSVVVGAPRKDSISIFGASDFPGASRRPRCPPAPPLPFPPLRNTPPPTHHGRYCSCNIFAASLCRMCMPHAAAARNVSAACGWTWRRVLHPS